MTMLNIFILVLSLASYLWNLEGRKVKLILYHFLLFSQSKVLAINFGIIGNEKEYW